MISLKLLMTTAMVLLAIVFISFMMLLSEDAEAATFNVGNISNNPCDYMNAAIESSAQQLDTGNDPNFERIKQQNNQQMILACQQYQIKVLENAKSDLNRDNY